jgi:alkyl hydroperoxide reductase subunit F
MMYDLVILGGGAAALSAATYTASKELNFAMLYDEFGGKVGWHPAGPDVDQYSADAARWAQVDRPDLPGDPVIRHLVDQLRPAPHRLVHDRTLLVERGTNGLRIDTRAHGVLEATSVIVATGASPVPLRVPGAHRLLMHGLSYSIHAYAHHVAGKHVAVIGSTLRALRGTAELARSAERVYVIARHGGYLATPIGVALRQLPKLEMVQDGEVTEVIGRDHVEELVVQHGGHRRRLHVDHAFVDLGLVPNSQAVLGLRVTDAHGFINVDRQNKTSVPGLFAAGDVTTAPCEQVLVAIGEGARAAISAYDYVLAQSLAANAAAEN